MDQDFLRNKLIEDALRALNCKPGEAPADLTDKQRDLVFGLAPGTTAVRRTRGFDPIPSYKIGRARRTPFSSVIEFKLKQLKECGGITA
jgi:hypothetical protein